MSKIFKFLLAKKWFILFVLAMIVIVIYKFYNPADYQYFPKCMFKTLSGYDCPGCGSQRAVHNLLNGNFTEAIRNNLLFVVSLPYVLLGAILDISKLKNQKIKRFKEIVYGDKILIIFAIILIFYWFFRNTTFYHKLIS